MSKELRVVRNLLSLEIQRANGSVVEAYLGPSEEQLEYMHKIGKCDWTCSYCIDEAEQLLEKEVRRGVITSSTMEPKT